jgi:hypothetical protein
MSKHSMIKIAKVFSLRASSPNGQAAYSGIADSN